MEDVDVSQDLPFIIDLDQNAAAPVVLNMTSSQNHFLEPGAPRAPLTFNYDNNIPEWETDSDNSDVDVVGGNSSPDFIPGTPENEGEEPKASTSTGTGGNAPSKRSAEIYDIMQESSSTSSHLMIDSEEDEDDDEEYESIEESLTAMRIAHKQSLIASTNNASTIFDEGTHAGGEPATASTSASAAALSANNANAAHQDHQTSSDPLMNQLSNILKEIRHTKKSNYFFILIY
jgi:hypothetical protein